MSERFVYLTREGYAKLDAELHHLRKVRRREVAQRLHEALSEGDLLENAELEAARNEQAFVEGRILELVDVLSRAEIITEGDPDGIVRLGSRVTVVEGDGPREAYHIVGSAEADPSEGKVSYESPFGKALMGHEVGDEVVVHTPGGELVFTVVEIH
ncbi:MAG: transcription elongation factor GreA [Anaerolineae bacterium]